MQSNLTISRNTSNMFKITNTPAPPGDYYPDPDPPATTISIDITL